MPVKTDPPQRPRTLARRINGILSACIVVFFLAHGILGSMLPFTGFESPLAWLVWAGVACVVVHIVLSIVTSREQLTDTVRPPSEAKKRHLLLKWITGILLAVVVVAHIVTIRVLGPEAVQSMVVGAALIVVLAVGFVVYVSDYYHADEVALAAVADEDGAADGVTVQTLPDGEIAFVPEHPVAGLIFYPGGKVQPEAYAPLLTMCAREGILCVLVKPPFNLAIFDKDAADGIAAQFPEVDTWLIGGHSLGGVSASMYLADHAEDFSGIVLLAAYPCDDLSGTSLEALSIFGSNDGVLDREKFSEAEDKLPQNSQEVVISGGNHANFGNYGAQAKDGEAGISREDQQAQAADAIADLVSR